MKNYRRWFSWGVLVFAFIIVFFHRLSMGAVSNLISSDLNLDSVQLGNLTAMTFYAYALMQLPVGIMVDTIGVRKICTVGMLVTAGGSIILGFSNTIMFAYLARFLVGLGTSVIIVSVMKIQSLLFDRRMYSTLSGLTSCFGNLGAFLATYPLAYAAMNFGWRKTFIILGVITIAVSIVIFLVVKESDEKLVKKVDQSTKINVKEALLEVIKNKYTWPNFILMMFFVGSLTSVLGLWGTSYLSNVYDISIDNASCYISFITYGFIIGAPFIGKLSDILNGRVRIILLPAACVYFLIWFYILIIAGGMPSIKMLPILFFVMGLALISHILAFSNVKDVNRHEYTGIATAFINIGEFLGGGLLSIIIGILIKYQGIYLKDMTIDVIYRNAMMVILISSFISIIAVWFIKDTKLELENN